MNQEDRKKVFWLLKKYSSYTAWKALGDAYAEFTAAFEYAVANSRNVSGELDQEEFDEFIEWNIDHLKTVLDGAVAFEKGLASLKKGEHSVFRRTGFLRRAAEAVVFVDQIMDPQEYVFDWMPNKNDVLRSVQTIRAKIGGLFLVNELDENDDIAPLGWGSAFDSSNGPFNFPAQLSDVPKISSLTILTGDQISVAGIWEPSYEKLTSEAQISTLLPGEPGCMNYFVAGVSAPKYQDRSGTAALHVAWHLVWTDHRYEDGVIPIEESEYIATEIESNTHPLQANLRTFPGEPCPKTGEWMVGHTPRIARRFTKGDIMPELNLDTGATIWMFVGD